MKKVFKYLLIFLFGIAWAFAINFTLSFQSPKITFFSAIALPFLLSLIPFFRANKFGFFSAYTAYWLMVFIVTRLRVELGYGDLFLFVGIPLLGLTSILIFPALFESLRLKEVKKIGFLLLFAIAGFSLQYYSLKKIIYWDRTPSIVVKKINIPELVSPMKQIISERFSNKIVVILFWSKHCGACKKNYPPFEILKQSYSSRQDIFFSAVNTGEKCSFDDFVGLCNKYNYDINYCMDQSESLIKQLNINAVPTTIIIDKEGNLRFMRTGFNSDYAEEYLNDLSEFIEKL